MHTEMNSKIEILALRKPLRVDHRNRSHIITLGGFRWSTRGSFLFAKKSFLSSFRCKIFFLNRSHRLILNRLPINGKIRQEKCLRRKVPHANVCAETAPDTIVETLLITFKGPSTCYLAMPVTVGKNSLNSQKIAVLQQPLATGLRPFVF